MKQFWRRIFWGSLVSLGVLSTILAMNGFFDEVNLGPIYVAGACKFFVMAVIIAYAIRKKGNDRGYKLFIISGLLCSLAGDELLIQGKNFFTAGVLAFMAAQLCYTQAFLSRRSEKSKFVYAWPGAIVALAIISLARDGWVVAVYAASLLMTVSQAWLCRRALGRFETSIAFGGAIMFLISDLILGVSRYIYNFPSASILMLLSYYSGQVLLAKSTGICRLETF